MSKFLLGPGGRLILVGGKPLSATPGVVVQAPNTGIALVQNYLGAGQTPHFNVQTTASSGDTTTDLPFLFTYTGGAPTSVSARVVDGNGTAVPGFDWADISSSIVIDGAGSAHCYLPNVPAGANYKRQIRAGAFNDADTVAFSVGPTILPWGQSNMVNTLEGGDSATGFGNVPGVTPTTDEGAYFRGHSAALFGQYGFVGLAAGSSSGQGNAPTSGAGLLAMLRNVATQMKTKFGREVGVCMNAWALNGTGIASWITPGQTGYAMLAGSGTTGGTIGLSSPANFIRGDYQVVAVHQGESQAANLTRAQRLADLKAFCQLHIDHVALFGRPANKLTFLFAIMQVAGTASNQFQMEVLRGAVLDLIADPAVIAAGWDVRIGWNCIDLDPANVGGGEAVHFGGMDRRRSNRRLTQAFMHALDPVGVPYGARGPMLTGAVSRAGDDITLTVSHEGGSGLTARTPGSPITGWYANIAADFSGTDIALTNVTIVDSTHIRVTATGAPATFYIKHCGNKFYTLHSYYPDVSNLIYDNFVYPTGADPSEQMTGLPLLPTPDAIRVG